MMEPNFKVNMNEYLPLRDVVFNTLQMCIRDSVYAARILPVTASQQAHG